MEMLTSAKKGACPLNKDQLEWVSGIDGLPFFDPDPRAEVLDVVSFIEGEFEFISIGP